MFRKDTIATGLLVGISSVIITGIIIYLTFLLSNIQMPGNMRFFLLAFIPNILLIRYYLKNLNYLKTGSTLIIILFIFMIPFFIYLFRFGELSF